MKTLSISLFFIFALLAGNLYSQNQPGKQQEKINTLDQNSRGGHVPASLEHRPESAQDNTSVKVRQKLDKKIKKHKVKDALEKGKPKTAREQGFGAALAALILAIVGIALIILAFFFFSNVFGPIGIILGIAALILGIIALVRGGLGFILALIGLIIAIIVIGLFIAVLVAIII